MDLSSILLIMNLKPPIQGKNGAKHYILPRACLEEACKKRRKETMLGAIFASDLRLY